MMLCILDQTNVLKKAIKGDRLNERRRKFFAL